MTGRWLLGSALGLLVFLALTGWVVATGGSKGFDLTVQQGVLAGRTPGLTALASVWTDLGAFPVVVGLAVAAAVALRVRSRGWVLPLTLAASVAVTAGIVFLIKIAVGRARPSIETLLGAPSLDFSFPSGHTTDGTVALLGSAVLLASTVTDVRVRRLLCAAGIVLAAGVGLTRVYLGYHWPTDVIAGWSLAVAVVCAAAWFAPTVSASLRPVPAEPALEPSGTVRR